MQHIVVLMQEERKDKPAAEFMRENLKEVLENTVDIQIRYLDVLGNESISEVDIVLVPVYAMLYEIKDYVKGNRNNILLATRTLSKASLKNIMSIPPNETVLVINKTLETTRDMLRLLYQLGIMHLNFIPYESSYTYEHCKYIITTSEPHLLPPHSAKVIEVGYRRLDTQTFLNIFSKLKIESDRLTRNLIKYIQNLPQKNTDVERRYLSYYLLNKTFVRVIEESDSGMIIVDKERRIIYCNQRANQILNSKFDKDTRFGPQLASGITEMIFSKEFSQELIQINDEYVLVKRNQLLSIDEVVGYCFDFKTAKSIHEMGSKLSTKLRKMGLYARYTFDEIVFISPAMEQCLLAAKAIAKTKHTAIIYGETGVGKELLAQSIHNYSARSAQPFVAINCAAFHEHLLESELFGYESGAFTGSKREGKIGLFELANKGTIFLDEIGDMPTSLQVKLLRVLQEQQIMRIGGTTIINIDVRVLTATNKDLLTEIENKSFRADLYYRLAVFTINVPPLRDRKEDILPLFKMFTNNDYSKLTEYDKQVLIEYPWPGNIRELKNTASYYSLLGNLSCITKSVKKPVEFQPKQIEKEILKILYEYHDIGMGRSKILSLLHDRKIALSEKRFENMIIDLIKKEYVCRKRGRGGIKLTTKGNEYCVKNIN